MSRTTRNSRDCDSADVVRDCVGSIAVESSPSTVAVEENDHQPFSVGEITTSVVQALQSQLSNLVNNAVEARFSSTSSSTSLGEGSSSVPASTSPLSCVPSFVDNLHASAGNLAVIGAASSSVAAVSEATGLPRMVNCLPSTRGRIIPSFVNTFSPAASSNALAQSNSSTTTSAGFSFPSVLESVGTSSLATGSSPCAPCPLPGVNAFPPFVVGPGYAPVPAKTVHAIVSGKFINLGDLLPEYALTVDETNEPQLLFDGRLVLTGTNRKPRKEVQDILSWVEAFTIFSVILSAYQPHRWRDLASYKLLILRTFRQFSGLAWYEYDRAFRQHAAASKITDWSDINVQLFNFHTAGASSRSIPAFSIGTGVSSVEPQGNSTCNTICISWNKGRCVAPFPVCRYKHACAKCFALHRESECRVPPHSGPVSYNGNKKRRF